MKKEAEQLFFLHICLLFCPYMIQIGEKIVSRDLFENHFICHLEKCEGNCCVFGDSGAPLEDDEAESLSRDLEKIFHEG